MNMYCHILIAVLCTKFLKARTGNRHDSKRTDGQKTEIAKSRLSTSLTILVVNRTKSVNS